MKYKGIARGKVIELEEPLPFADGQYVSVTVEPEEGREGNVSPTGILETLKRLPPLSDEAWEVFEQALEEGEYIPGTKEAILEGLRHMTPISREDAEALERAIEEGKLPVREEGIFDEDER